MKNTIRYIFAFLAISLIFVSCSKNPTDPSEIGTQTSTYIVVFNQTGNSIQGANIDSRIKDIFAKYQIDLNALKFTYDVVLDGFAAELTDNQLEALKADKSIKYIEKDQTITLDDPVISIESGKSNKIQGTQPIPWGVAYVGGPKTNTNVYAWIVDTGIDFTHPDLNVDITTSKTFVSKTKTADDDNGHGTHVSGIIAAYDNDFGVVGVCPGASLIAVKVLNRQGSGTYSAIIAGINYVAANLKTGINAVNMSFGGGVSQTLDNAVLALASSGTDTKKVFVCIAAGNSSANANNYSPARVNGTNIFTISAFDINGAFASFSNYGNPPIDFSAPGVNIYSCYKNDSYATMSGTSMATPHVVGILLSNFANGVSVINNSGTVTGDKDNTPDLKAHL